MSGLKADIAKAMRDSDHWVIETDYSDAWGDTTRRIISPIRFIKDDAVLALCLGRETPRTFKLAKFKNTKLVPADQVLMPAPIKEIQGGGPSGGKTCDRSDAVVDPGSDSRSEG